MMWVPTIASMLLTIHEIPVRGSKVTSTHFYTSTGISGIKLLTIRNFMLKCQGIY